MIDPNFLEISRKIARFMTGPKTLPYKYYFFIESTIFLCSSSSEH